MPCPQEVELRLFFFWGGGGVSVWLASESREIERKDDARGPPAGCLALYPGGSLIW